MLKRTRLSKLIALAILPAGIAFGGAAFSAAGDEPRGSAPMKEDKARGKDMRKDEPRAGKQAMQKGDSYWASDVIGKNVAVSGGRDGEIKDLIVNAETGEVRHAVTKLSAEKGGDRLYAVPLRMFNIGADHKFTLNVDRAWLAQRKSWSEDKWPDMNDRAYWGDDERTAAATEPPRTAPTAPDRTATAPTAKDPAVRASTPAHSAHRLSKLMGQDVANAQGKEIGEIKDVVVNMKSQKVEFVLFGHDPGIMQAEKEYAVPLTAFRFPATTADGGDEGKRRVVLNVGDDKIKGMKPFAKADKERINDPGFISEIKQMF